MMAHAAKAPNMLCVRLGEVTGRFALTGVCRRQRRLTRKLETHAGMAIGRRHILISPMAASILASPSCDHRVVANIEMNICVILSTMLACTP